MKAVVVVLVIVLLISHLIVGQVEVRPRGGAEYRVIEIDDTNINRRRRQLAPYQLCLLCKCCTSGSSTTCLTMPCCFGIDCNLPNKPFGVCAFVPKTCNCTSCTTYR